MPPAQPHAQPYPEPYIEEGTTEAQRNWGLAQHLVGLLSLADQTFIGLIAAVVLWRIKSDDSEWLDDHGREAVNFQLSLMLYAIAGSIIVAIISLGVFAPITIPIWLLFLIVLRIYGCVKGAIAAHNGAYYRYPMSIRFFTPKNAG